jgi:hypothetical protein
VLAFGELMVVDEMRVGVERSPVVRG